MVECADFFFLRFFVAFFSCSTFSFVLRSPYTRHYGRTHARTRTRTRAHIVVFPIGGFFCGVFSFATYCYPFLFLFLSLFLSLRLHRQRRNDGITYVQLGQPHFCVRMRVRVRVGHYEESITVFLLAKLPLFLFYISIPPLFQCPLILDRVVEWEWLSRHWSSLGVEVEPRGPGRSGRERRRRKSCRDQISFLCAFS